MKKKKKSILYHGKDTAKSAWISLLYSNGAIAERTAQERFAKKWHLGPRRSSQLYPAV